ncbi:bifunctional acetaldehyde-CoA/alcohol dehydrogenase [Paenibacillus sp. GXUN7292]|uniref:bifunctional acetaldehyde-CoA/alcohol dehydrogenase n=1 Tax=Paenibacillus sp. GXUN7292 TaxID=3422499 RepID=UPI003D7DD52D
MAAKDWSVLATGSAAALTDVLVSRAKQAQEQFMSLSQEQVDLVVHKMALAGLDQHMKLAKLAVEETGKGIYEDKITKNLFATESVCNSMKEDKTVGIIETNEYENYNIIAEPVGVIAGIIPYTDPTSAAMFKALLAIKTRNPIIFIFHPAAEKSSTQAAKELYKAAVQAGAPKHCIQWLEQPSSHSVDQLLKHKEIALILASGDDATVQAAHRTGKPTLGLSPGNVPCLIDRTANLKQAVTDLIMSKTFDNGMLSASEQSVIIEEAIYPTMKHMMTALGCYFMNQAEIQAVSKLYVAMRDSKLLNDMVGQSALWIAEKAGISVPQDTLILIAELAGVGDDYPLSAQKQSPILACYKVKDAAEGIERAAGIINYSGAPHSAVIHSHDQETISAFASRLQAVRIIINSPSTLGAIGDYYTTNLPYLSLSSGHFGHSSSTGMSSVKLLNLKRISERAVHMQWFKIPPKLYFEKGSTQYLSKIPNIHRIVIVTDKSMVELGYVNKVEYYLRKRKTPVQIEIIADVESDPSIETVHRGAAIMNRFQPDCIIALGGGSPIDAAKAMWLFYEYPDTDFNSAKMKFLDIRNKVYKYPKLGQKAQLVAIPTTSGTGSEVTSYAAITDTQDGVMKYPLLDNELTPNIAIIDPEFTYSLPDITVADAGMDVLTHAIEAYVSIMASDFTDGLAMKAISLVFEHLEHSFATGDKTAREKMHNASTIAGMAFANAYLGVNHSLAHKFGIHFKLSHGRTNAILLPYVIRYNASRPTKFQSYSNYDHYQADTRYADIARMLGLPARSTEEGVSSLIEAIRKLNRSLGIPDSFQAASIAEEEFIASVDKLAGAAFEDQCTTTNPRMPLISELALLYRNAYYGILE